MRHRLARRVGPAFERDNPGFDVGRSRPVRQTEELSSPKATLPGNSQGQSIGDVARPGEIVSDDSKQHFRATRRQSDVAFSLPQRPDL